VYPSWEEHHRESSNRGLAENGVRNKPWEKGKPGLKRRRLKPIPLRWFESSCSSAPRAGLEPATLRLTAACSTIELSRNSNEYIKAGRKCQPLFRRFCARRASSSATSESGTFLSSSITSR
jgi:hypothetical protein